jgi:hypothetical protein
MSILKIVYKSHLPFEYVLISPRRLVPLINAQAIERFCRLFKAFLNKVEDVADNMGSNN